MVQQPVKSDIYINIAYDGIGFILFLFLVQQSDKSGFIWLLLQCGHTAFTT
jgi:hypothetical protein